MNKNFNKASELLRSKNNIVVTDQLKEKFSHLEKANITEIHGFLKPPILKESYERPSLKPYKNMLLQQHLKILKKIQESGHPDLKNLLMTHSQI
jgi:hypothetical protein